MGHWKKGLFDNNSWINSYNPWSTKKQTTKFMSAKFEEQKKNVFIKLYYIENSLYEPGTKWCHFLIIFLLTVKILKIGTPKIITIIVLQLEQLDFTVQYCVQKMQTE